MARSHNFNFEGGAYLTQMSATWFVSYTYYQNLDSAHKNWAMVSTVDMRSNIYNRTKQYHKFWLQQVLMMDDKRLNTNSIELEAKQTKYMAKTLLEKIYN